jgi:competence/damage-inducible protein CinA-like protein
MPHAELLAIGTELLLGEIVDTNSAHIARALRGIGLDLYYISQIGDNEERIAQAVAQGLARSGIVITTGGLGPTVDDVTREAVARATGRPLRLDPDLLAQIEARFAQWGRRMTDNNRRQAMIPAGAIAVRNPVGTAPAFIVETEGGAAISVPGVPKEMEYLLEHAVLPYLRERFGLTGVIKARVLRTAGLGESVVDQKVAELETLSNPTVGLAAHPGSVDVRITAKAASEAEADRLIAGVEAQARARLGDAIFGVDGETLESVLLALLAARGLTLAVAEANTDGVLTARLAAVHGQDAVFAGGAMAHTPQALANQLGVTSTDEAQTTADGRPQSADGGQRTAVSGRLGPLAEAVARRSAEHHKAAVGLACLIEHQAGGVRIGVGLAWGEAGRHDELGFGGHVLLLPQWAASHSFDRLRRWLLE